MHAGTPGVPGLFLLKYWLLTRWPEKVVNGPRSKWIRGQSLNFIFPRPARLQPGAVPQRDCVLAMQGRLEFFDAADVDDNRTVDPHEGFGMERFFERVHCDVEQVDGAPHVQLNVIFGGFNPVDVIHVDEERLARGSDREALQRAMRRRNGFEQRKD